MNFDAPEAARNNARRVLAWRKKYGSKVRGMTPVGWTRANQLASGERLSRETVGRMASFFARHEKNKAVAPEHKNEPWRDAGYVAWLGWGGDTGAQWAMSIMDRERKGVKAQAIEITAQSTTVTSAVEAGDAPKFSVLAYNGGPLSVAGYDLPIVLDLSGLKEGRRVIANLHHDKKEIVGHVSAVKNDGRTLTLDGVASAVSPASKQFLDSAANGFPWSASIEARPDPGSTEEIPKGKTVMVNGQTVAGPVYVSRKSTLYGVAFLPHGADQNTNVSVAASAVDSTHERGASMFDQWVEAQGFDSGTLTDTQRKSLQRQYDAENAEKPVEAGFDVDEIKALAGEAMCEVEASLAEHEGEVPTKKFAEIKAGALKGHRELKAKAIREKWTGPQFEIEATKFGHGVKLDLVRATASHEGPAIHVSRKDESPEVIEAALCMAAGLNCEEQRDKNTGRVIRKAFFSDQVLEAANKQYRNIGIQQVLLMAAASNGMRVSPFERVTETNLRGILKASLASGDVHANSFSTLGVSVGNILSNVATKELVAGYQEVDDTWREISQIKSVRDFKQVTTYRLLDDMAYEQIGPGGEIKHGSVGQESYTRQVKTYAKMFALTREDIINDDLGAFDDLRTRLGAGAAMKMRDVFWAAFLNNGSFFTSGRGNYITGSTTTLLSDGVGLGLGVKAFRTMVTSAADGAKRIGGEPEILLVPPELEVVAKTLNQSTNFIGGTTKDLQTNIYANRYRPVIVPQLSDASFTGNSATAWYLFRSPSLYAPMVVSFLNGQQSPTVESADADFNTLGIQFRGYHDFGVDQAEYISGVKSKGAA